MHTGPASSLAHPQPCREPYPLWSALMPPHAEHGNQLQQTSSCTPLVTFPGGQLSRPEEAGRASTARYTQKPALLCCPDSPARHPCTVPTLQLMHVAQAPRSKPHRNQLRSKYTPVLEWKRPRVECEVNAMLRPQQDMLYHINMTVAKTTELNKSSHSHSTPQSVYLYRSPSNT